MEHTVVGSTDAQRRLEIEAGRARVREIARTSNTDDDLDRRFKLADEELKRDEERRHHLLHNTGVQDKVALDRAGAEVADQAQTQLEAALHLADRDDRITTAFQQEAAERLESVDVGEVAKASEEAIVAQAVNQPTPLANERGLPTEGRPLNVSDFSDDELELARVETPEDRMTPKTTAQAEDFAVARNPDPEQVVRPGWHDFERTLQQDGEPVRHPRTGEPMAPPVEPEAATAAAEEVEQWPEEVKPPELKDAPEGAPEGALDRFKRTRKRKG
jgi:hypothetical protein